MVSLVKSKKAVIGLCFMLMMAYMLVFPISAVAASNSNNSNSGEVYVTFEWVEDQQWETTYSKYEMVVHNNTDKSICNWVVNIGLKYSYDFSSGCCWNAVGKISNNVFSVTAKDGDGFSAVLDPWGNYNSAGFWVRKDAVDFSKVSVDYEYGNSTTITQPTTTQTPSTNQPNVVPAGAVEITGTTKNLAMSETPVGIHGKLGLNGTQLVDKNGDAFILRGVSTHGINWFPAFVDKTGFQNLRDEWGVNAVRLAMYTVEYNGYTTCDDNGKNALKNIVNNGVAYATDLGMYAIIDWHILNDLNPLVHQKEAETFFEEMSAKYANYDNVIYEICNEPNGGTSWTDIKKYADVIIGIIRNNDPDAIIIVGTPEWSQLGDSVTAVAQPYNVMYAMHFYSHTHRDTYRGNVTKALNRGLPVFVSEYGVCDSSGNTNLDLDEATVWLNFLDDNGISYFCWSFSNKPETASLIKSSSSKTSGYNNNDLTEAGQWLVNEYNARAEKSQPTTPSQPTVDTNKNGLYYENNVWYYYTKGVIDTSYAGLTNYNGGWFYVSNGMLDTAYAGLTNYNGGWYYVANGILDCNYVGLVNYNGGWYYVANGIIDCNYAGLVSYGGWWYYVANGIIDIYYAGLTNYNGGWYYVANGILDCNYVGLVLYNGWWYYVASGTLDCNYVGLTNYNGGWYYVSNGALDVNYVGFTEYNGVKYHISNGIID